MNSILQKIAETKKTEIEAAKRQKPLAALIAEEKPLIRNFIEGLKQKKTAIIAEIKKASPSKGIIRQDFDVAKIAKIYEAHGAACLSVLTDESYFQGHPGYLGLAKAETKLPVLRKDFIIDPYQIYESRSLGADCILLIVALLDDKQLQDFTDLAATLNMAVLVESHDEAELERALKLPTPLMGINNRSLHHFKTDLETSKRLVQYIPKDKIAITESGINTKADIAMMEALGIHTFLIGEALMRAEDIGSTLDTLLTG